MKRLSIFLACLLLVLYGGCTKSRTRTAVAQGVTAEIPAQESWKSTIILTDSGRTSGVVKTGYLKVYAKSLETYLDSSVHVDFYNRQGRVSTVLTSKRGKVDDRTKNLYAYEDVVVKNDSGVVVQSEELVWNNVLNKITTDKFVTITTKTERIQGYGFESDQYIRNYVIHRITYVTNVKSINE